MDTTPRHPIGVAARRTGLKPDLIRAWERRYGAVEPGRSGTRRRLYSDADIERLLLLRRVVLNTGHAIGSVAGWSNGELQALLDKEPAAPPPSRRGLVPPRLEGLDETESLLELCLAAAQRLDARELELQIERASVALSRTHLLEKLLVPLMQRIGDLWHEGTLRPLHEHMASSVVRSFLGSMRGACQTDPTAPQMVATTPARQHHEMGALIAAATAAGEGWQVTYLGPDLPPEEIAAAALQKQARAVALSLTYPPDDLLLADELRKLRRLLGPRVAVIAGGRAASSYAAVLDAIGALRLADMAALRQELPSLRTIPSAGDGDLR